VLMVIYCSPCTAGRLERNPRPARPGRATNYRWPWFRRAWRTRRIRNFIWLANRFGEEVHVYLNHSLEEYDRLYINGIELRLTSTRLSYRSAKL
jgi:hypothetical protein